MHIIQHIEKEQQIFNTEILAKLEKHMALTSEEIEYVVDHIFGLPTSAELYTLLNKCTMEWIDGEEKKYKNTNAKGYLFTGKDAFISNKVFLPTAGDCVFGYASGQGMHGDYWSSTYYSSTTSCFLYFDMNRLTVTTEDREYGFSVRAVLNENK